jgi:hypothetical protein
MCWWERSSGWGDKARLPYRGGALRNGSRRVELAAQSWLAGGPSRGIPDLYPDRWQI